MAEAGHSFLARLGKTRLRPGGIEATNWLFEHVSFDKNKHILEVACNQCTNAIALVSKTGCSITAVDLDKEVVELARNRVAEAGLSDKIKVERANALKLPYPDQSFDVVINEAMLTMLGDKQKIKAISEYYRVLKPGGILLTHDVKLAEGEMTKVIEELQKAIHVPAKPHNESDWREIFTKAGFEDLTVSTGSMTLMDPIGMIKDEGLVRTLKIFKNAIKKENRVYFKAMFHFFRTNKANLGYIAIVARK
ncbi:class I SAM-dependent methyltransferase [Amphibacillus sp. MSJ-3]|uniref:class I SAM-dependent methyltransferase n=1 Tax=Amphibacillus sp. MSJ-3 TaxID=2841505 RepID=UPI001C0F2E80|nr:class I SAM-dependent methyltransferase [Amphibacillus sp. MSJ-3]MBU5595132.1 class I SAM-dependent methyltransferase [Amphibacillus sp. MSJ-3]